ncbi:hypothetical protein KAJ89_05320 [Candidatus Parcubacteria bacterium]|nr:hypothetical protein [Candidatus Parcubacteria bacterium]
MKKILKAHKYDIVIIGLLLVLILGWQFFYAPQDDSAHEAIAAEFNNTGDPFHGWAWNDNIGWLSFNCENTDVCASSDYSVGAEDLGDLTARLAGCAYSELAGWLCFDTPDVPPDTPATSTMLDLTTNELSGWARFCSLTDTPAACSGGAAGWVKMRCLDECAASDYGVYMTNDQSLHGQAYSDDYGWINFNCEEAGPSQQDWCATSSYHVAMNTNVSGYAYSSTTDWISFNCNNESECGSSTYGVHIDYNTKNFAGYAWSDNVGWISFQEGSLPGAGVDYSFNTNCQDTCDGSNDCTACLGADNNVYGWANVLSYGNDGWIKLNDSAAAIPYNVLLNGADFEGWAYNGNDTGTGIGWVSFNCNEGGPNGEDICGSVPYTVTYGEYFTYNQAPTTTNPIVFEYSTYCNNSVFERRLNWTFTDPDAGDTQSAYRVIIDDDPGAGGQPPGTPDFDSGKCVNAGDNGGKCIDAGNIVNLWVNDINNPAFWDNYTMGYNDTFYWWIMVWDQSDEPSADWNVGESFAIDAGEWPDPSNITRTPWNYSAGEEVLFESRDMGIYYSGSTANPCDTTNCSWLWTEDPDLGFATILSSNASSSIIIFSDMDPTNIRLQLTSNGNTCEISTSTDAGVRLPSWIETQ